MKKGFTLVELLCVIVIIAIISLITFPRVNDYIRKTKEGLYKTQIKDLEKSGEKWALDNIKYLDKYHINDTFITLQLLKDFNYLEKDDILNPKTKDVMDGCILITYKDNKYSYKYIDDECAEESVDLSELSSSYIVYDSTDSGDSSIINNAKDNSHTPFYELVLQNNEIKVLGETSDGLYEFDDEYVFRGTNVNNYVKYNGSNWRILSIDKNNYSMKLINTTSRPSTSITTELETDMSSYSKLLNEWYDGPVNNIDVSILELNSIIKQHSMNSKLSLISLYDYAIASLNPSCYDNINTGGCSTNNYLTTIFNENSFWTMNKNSSNNYWYVNTENSINEEATDSGIHNYAMVIKVPMDVYNTKTSATGSDTTFAYEIQ